MKNSKYFATKDEFDKWLVNRFPRTVEEMVYGKEETPEEIISALLADGYTDLNNLVTNGDTYQVGEYTNLN